MSATPTTKPTFATIEPASQASERIKAFVYDQVDRDAAPFKPERDEFWKRLNVTETELWLDSGDIESIDSLWDAQFSGLTTNNTLLNKEVQNGTYDDLVPQTTNLVEQLPEDARVREIAFILNLCHGLNLAQRFGCKVSVELHTDVANDSEATLAFARRCQEICPDSFVVKVPLTPAGLIAIRKLRDENIRVNCTLGFSARQNYVATALARPSFVNVFLGRLNSYVADNQLGDGKLVGEKTALSSQTEVATFTRGLPATDTRQIAASLRDASQLPRLAGIDVITMPAKVAQQAKQTLRQPWKSQLNEQHSVQLAEDRDPARVRIEKLWHVSNAERKFVQKAILSPVASADELKRMAADHGLEDLFPTMADTELQTIAGDGKIPQHHRWEERIERGDLAIDSLMTLAGLASFTASQAELDQRIRKHLH
ncbi:transaldolase family protein [Roseimaritima ulvae]|uniref:Putative transaldolase n=1 Tax=Roseimaritima ulvae TaxID=980254 RepID=A0A5B9QQU3_9BACT|nr:transaldolase family protein [Roseimaritima ulvae]QEG41477.1 putative transaldolase [Roseimaritima ulvae]